MKSALISFAVLAAIPLAANAVDFPTSGDTTARAVYSNSPGVLSNYGQIQNVQTYSSNPYFNINSPYNQRIPTPIYAQGTDVKTAECQQLAEMLVANACAAQNNCAGKQISDIRPAVLVQMSNVPGGNYAMSCAGYIDGAFANYMESASTLNIKNAFPTGFPAGTTSTQTKSQDTAQQPPKTRAQELADLQAQNADDIKLTATQMPETINNLSFVERNENTKQGLQEWKCDPTTGKGCAYQSMKIQTNSDAISDATELLKGKMDIIQDENALLKETDPKAYYIKFPAKCYEDYQKLADTKNEGLKDAACNSGATSVMLWQPVPNEETGCDVKKTKKLVLSDSDCDRENKCAEYKKNPTQCYTDKNAEAEIKNQASHKNACIGKAVGTKVKAQTFIVEPDAGCGCKIKSVEQEITCGQTNTTTGGQPPNASASATNDVPRLRL